MKKSMKQILCTVLLIVMLVVLASGCQTKEPASSETKAETTTTVAATTEAPREKVEIEFHTWLPEYQPQYEEIWSEYEAANPNVTIKISTLTEGQESALQARISAGTPPHISEGYGINKSNYTTFANLLDIDYPYWDLIKGDYKAYNKMYTGVDDYLVYCPTDQGYQASFLYYTEDMDKAGLKPRDTVRTMEDLDKFLADLKVYVDKSPDIDYVWDTSWEPWFWTSPLLVNVAASVGGGLSAQQDLWSGKIRFDDPNNPYGLALKKLKEWYKLGYFPDKLWSRQWEPDFEASFIAKKSIFCYHGPWLWDKVLQSNPDAKLSGFPMPASNGKIVGNAIYGISGIYSAHKDKPYWSEVVRAFNWWKSPETVKKTCEATGTVPAMDFPGLGEVTLTHPQYLNVVKAVQDGFYGAGVTLDNSVWPSEYFSMYKKEGAPYTWDAQDVHTAIMNYFDDKGTYEDMLKAWQQYYDTNYSIPK